MSCLSKKRDSSFSVVSLFSLFIFCIPQFYDNLDKCNQNHFYVFHLLIFYTSPSMQYMYSSISSGENPCLVKCQYPQENTLGNMLLFLDPLCNGFWYSLCQNCKMHHSPTSFSLSDNCI